MINIIYEDNHLLVVEKPINVPVQADESKNLDLLTMLKDFIKKRDNKKGNVYLGLVHRLDRPVGGIMVFAKTSKCAERLSKQIRDCILQKTYYAVVEGKINKEGTFKDRLLKDRKSNIVKVDESGKESMLNYELIDYKNGLSLVKINLITGRSHQIRVHSKALVLEHPITKEKIKFELDLPSREPFSIFKNNYYM